MARAYDAATSNLGAALDYLTFNPTVLCLSHSYHDRYGTRIRRTLSNPSIVRLPKLQTVINM